MKSRENSIHGSCLGTWFREWLLLDVARFQLGTTSVLNARGSLVPCHCELPPGSLPSVGLAIDVGRCIQTSPWDCTLGRSVLSSLFGWVLRPWLPDRPSRTLAVCVTGPIGTRLPDRSTGCIRGRLSLRMLQLLPVLSSSASLG